MYNEEIKRRFIEEYCALHAENTSASATMHAVEAAENKVGKDIAQMTAMDAESAVYELDLNSLGSLYLRRVVIGQYLTWCRENHMFDHVEDGFLNALSTDLDISPAIAKMIIRDDNDLIFSLRKVCDFNNGYYEPVILALAWEGLSKQQILSLRDSDVDTDNRRIIIDGNIVIPWFSDNICDILRQYVDTRTGLRENRTATYQVVKDYSHDTFIKRFVTPDSVRLGKPLSLRNIEGGLSRVGQKYVELGYPPRLTFINVRKSGRYHALWEMEQTGTDVFSRENEDAVTQLMGEGKYRNILWFYRAYKKAFNL